MLQFAQAVIFSPKSTWFFDSGYPEIALPLINDYLAVPTLANILVWCDSAFLALRNGGVDLLGRKASLVIGHSLKQVRTRPYLAPTHMGKSHERLGAFGHYSTARRH